MSPDEVRRVVELRRGDEVWHIEVQDTESDEHAKERVTSGTPELPAIVDQNGGDWQFYGIHGEFPHER